MADNDTLKLVEAASRKALADVVRHVRASKEMTPKELRDFVKGAKEGIKQELEELAKMDTWELPSLPQNDTPDVSEPTEPVTIQPPPSWLQQKRNKVVGAFKGLKRGVPRTSARVIAGAKGLISPSSVDAEGNIDVIKGNKEIVDLLKKIEKNTKKLSGGKGTGKEKSSSRASSRSSDSGDDNRYHSKALNFLAENGGVLGQSVAVAGHLGIHAFRGTKTLVDKVRGYGNVSRKENKQIDQFQARYKNDAGFRNNVNSKIGTYRTAVKLNGTVIEGRTPNAATLTAPVSSGAAGAIPTQQTNTNESGSGGLMGTVLGGLGKGGAALKSAGGALLRSAPLLAVTGVAAHSVNSALDSYNKLDTNEDASNMYSKGANAITQAVTGEKDVTLGTKVYDKVDTLKRFIGISDLDKEEAAKGEGKRLAAQIIAELKNKKNTAQVEAKPVESQSVAKVEAKPTETITKDDTESKVKAIVKPFGSEGILTGSTYGKLKEGDGEAYFNKDRPEELAGVEKAPRPEDWKTTKSFSSEGILTGSTYGKLKEGDGEAYFKMSAKPSLSEKGSNLKSESVNKDIIEAKAEEQKHQAVINAPSNVTNNNVVGSNSDMIFESEVRNSDSSFRRYMDGVSSYR